MPAKDRHNKLILVADDESAIRETLTQVLEDEGFDTCFAEDGLSALEQIDSLNPDLVILDIWMPQMDGMEALKKIRVDYPVLPVIMISGHATISTAVHATRIGAVDFIEKPLDLDTTIESVKKALEKDLSDNSNSHTKICEEELFEEETPFDIDSSIYNKYAEILPSERRRQKTLASNSLLYGVGVHSGQKSGLILEPLPVNSGIHFANVSSRQTVPAHLLNVSTTGFATTIKSKDVQVSTIEHLMSALHAYGITNLLVKCNGEVPVMDGSALEFCKIIEDIGVKEQDELVHAIEIKETIRVGNEVEYIEIEPAEGFTIDYTLRYPEPIGEQRYVYKLGSEKEYKEQIAPARTFGFVKDISYLQEQGLAQGGRFDNFVLIGEEGAINVDLRFPDEQVRHKILDAIGDLYLLGRPLKGKITACMTGHSDNAQLLKKIFDTLN